MIIKMKSAELSKYISYNNTVTVTCKKCQKGSLVVAVPNDLITTTKNEKSYMLPWTLEFQDLVLTPCDKCKGVSFDHKDNYREQVVKLIAVNDHWSS